MEQRIENNGALETQVNINSSTGPINIGNKTRLQKRFEKLQEEVRSDSRYESFIDEFVNYNTIRDGIGLEQKLIDAGFNENEIVKAMSLKERYTKRVILGEMFLSQQRIDVDIFSFIDNNFDTYVFPKIRAKETKEIIKQCLMEKIIQPIIELLNREGECDEYLNYNENDIFGMVYFLTGKCHLNWKVYDTL
jgi:hypothetical protein